MDLLIKQKIYIWVIIGLILLNLSILLLIWLDGPGRPVRDQRENRLPVRDFFNKEFDLSPEQQKAFDESREAHFKAVDTLIRQLEAYRKKINEEVYKDKPDNARISVIADSIGIITARTEKLRVEHFAKLYSLLNEEQKVKFKKMLSETVRERIIRFRGDDRNPPMRSDGPMPGPVQRREDFPPPGGEMPPPPDGEGIQPK
jgi:Spy/CpxP family protein refolding chaperone